MARDETAIERQRKRPYKKPADRDWETWLRNKEEEEQQQQKESEQQQKESKDE